MEAELIKLMTMSESSRVLGGLFHTELIELTFDACLPQLPSLLEIKEHILTDGCSFGAGYDSKKSSRTHVIRDLYTKYSFPLLTHEFLCDLKYVVKTHPFLSVHELSCGVGWFSFWMKKYGIPLQAAVDNNSWQHKISFLDFVQRVDSIHHVKQHPEADLFILSWPYMDNVAERIWKAMQPGQYLLYIGEGGSGCTATEEFHNAVDPFVLKSETHTLQQHFVSFWAVHDRPYLYKKE